MKERVGWVDVAKFLGIFAIYLGHFGSTAGYAYGFVFKYHVELFFFLSGCMNFYDKEENYGKFFLKKFKSLILPLWIFSILSIVVNIIVNNGSIASIPSLLVAVAKGNIRNSFFAGSLWFLSCLFVIELVFKIIKYTKNKLVILVAIIIMYTIGNNLLVPHPLNEPHWIYNADSMFCYILFYGIGYLAYPYILWLFELNSPLKRILFYTTGSFALFTAALLFFKIDFIIPALLPFYYFACVVRTLIVIWANIIVAKLLENVLMFKDIGINTLYLCGNEYIIRNLASVALSSIGLSLQYTNPLSTYIWTMVFLIIQIKVLIPFEKTVVHSCLRALQPQSTE